QNRKTRPVTVGARSVPRRCPWGAGPSSPGELRYYAKTLGPSEITQTVMGKLLIKIGKLNRAPGGARSMPRLCSWGAGPSSPGEFRYYEKTVRPNEIIQVLVGKPLIQIGKLGRAPGGARSVPRRCPWGAGPSSPGELRYYAKTLRPNEITQTVMGY